MIDLKDYEMVKGRLKELANKPFESIKESGNQLDITAEKRFLEMVKEIHESGMKVADLPQLKEAQKLYDFLEIMISEKRDDELRYGHYKRLIEGILELHFSAKMGVLE